VSKKVLVGLSGGVDSAFAAYLLKKQGYEVEALYLKLHGREDYFQENITKAKYIADVLNIPLHILDVQKDFFQIVYKPFVEIYISGATPNPCIVCNREMKFGKMFEFAKKIGADYLATGHYLKHDNKFLIEGKDKNKDQSYFLCQLNQAQLSKALFPIGELTKPEVRKLATELDLVTANKKDSQGLCFIGKVSLPDFLQQKLKPISGNIVEISVDSEIYSSRRANTLKEQAAPIIYHPEDGKIVGEHRGAHYFTVGQRKGLQVGGSPKPLFVIATDVKTNTIYVGQGDDHPGLMRPALFIKNEDVHWVRPDLALPVGDEKDYDVRIRYRQPYQDGKLVSTDEGIYIVFKKPQRAIAAGQFAAWYLNDELIGSGVID